jgi:predicted thioesterase
MTGCSGGEQQNNRSQGSKDHSQGSKAQTTNQESTSKQAANRESLSGTVVDTLPDMDKVVIRPNWKGLKNAKVVKFKYRPDNVEVTVAGEEANPDAISVGQQATVKYVRTTQNGREVNIARSIQATVSKESLSGTVVDTLPDTDEVTIRTTDDEDVQIKYNPDDVNVTLAGEEANPDAISVGQQATVSYAKTMQNGREVNVARSIWLQPGSGTTQGNETTG